MRQLLLILLLMLTTEMSRANGVDIIRDRLIDEAITRGRVDDTVVKELITSFIERDSIWSSINYQDTTSIAFEHTRHLSNMENLARAYKTDTSEWYRSSDVKRVLDLSLGFWVSHNFLCQNWWHNEIGTPESMLTILYMMNDDLTQTQVDGILKIAGRAHLNAWGARQSGDRIHMASLEVKQHIYRRDIQKIKEVFTVIGEEMTFRNRERGLQVDYSFHHRIDRANNTVTYGLNFVNTFGKWVEFVKGTEFQFSEDKLKIAIDYYLDGVCKHMVFGRIIDENTKNRDIARQSSVKVMDARVPRALMESTSYRRDELANIVNARSVGEYTPLSFAKYYWEAEHFAFQRPKYFTSVRLYSPRNANMEEPYNGEGILNHFKCDGANYVAHKGGEHLVITPYNDWQKIPGTTVLQLETMPDKSKIQQYNKRSFVGGVCDGMYGAVVFDFLSPISGISAKKSWFFFDDEYVCLGAGINSESDFSLVTTIEQVKLDGDVTLKADKGIFKQPSHNLTKENRLEWVHHNNVGYYFPEEQDVVVSNQEQVGSWRMINLQKSVSTSEVSGDVFKMWIDHGARSNNASYSYIVSPYIDCTQMAKKRFGDIKIVRNDVDVQAVRHEKLDILYVIFHKAREVRLGDGASILVDQPCVLMVRYGNKGSVDRIYLSDPARDKSSVTITCVDGKKKNCYYVNLPQGDYCGSTVEAQKI